MTSLMVLTVHSNKNDQSRVKYKKNFQSKGHSIIKINHHILYSNGTKYCQTEECELLNSEAGAAGAVMARAAAAAMIRPAQQEGFAI